MDNEYWKKVGKGLLIAIGGAVLTYVSTTVIPGLQDSGNATMLLIAAIASTLVNAAQKAILG